MNQEINDIGLRGLKSSMVTSFAAERAKEKEANPGGYVAAEKRHHEAGRTEAIQGTGKWVVWGAVAVAVLGSCVATIVGPVGTMINNATYRAQETSLLSKDTGVNERTGENYFLNSLQDFRFLRNGSSGFLDQYDYFQNPGPQGSTDKQIFDLRADGFKKAIKLAAAKNFGELEKLKTQKDFNPADVELNISLLKNFSKDNPNLVGPDLIIEYYKKLTAKQGIPFDDKTKADLTILILK